MRETVRTSHDLCVLTWIVGSKSDNEIPVWLHHEGISPHWCRLESTVVVWIVEACVRRRAIHSLEIVSVQVERVLAWIIVVEYNLDYVALVEHKAVCIVAIDGFVTSRDACCKDAVKSRHQRRSIRDIVEKGTKVISNRPRRGLATGTY